MTIPCSDPGARFDQLFSACTSVARAVPVSAAMVLVLGACVATETEQTNTTMTSSSSTFALPPAPPQPDELEWERVTDGATPRPTVPQVEVDDATVDPEFNDICPLPDGGAIGVGSHGLDGTTPAVWLTEDGERWESAVVDGDPFGPGFNSLNRCDSDEDRIYVAGSHGSPPSAAVWTTTDGRNFERLDHGSFPEFTSVSDIEVFSDGRIWIVGPIWAPEGDGASTIVELDDTGAIMKLERLDAPEFIAPTGFASIWSITGSADKIILLGRLWRHGGRMESALAVSGEPRPGDSSPGKERRSP